MARTTAADVKTIISTSLGDSDVDTFITTANLMVDNILGDSSLADNLLEQIEKWVTAHLIAMSRDRTASREEVDNVRVDYTGEFGKNLDATPYGQMVTTLDYTGVMKKLGEKQAGLWSVKSDY